MATISIAALRTKFGNFVLPTDAAIMEAAASTSSIPKAIDTTWSSLCLGQTTSSSAAYPAAHFSFFVVYLFSSNSASWNMNTAALLANFLTFINSPAGQPLMPSGYVLLPEPLRIQNIATASQYVRPAQGNGAGMAAAATAPLFALMISLMIGVLIL